MREENLSIMMIIPRLGGGGAERQLGYLSRGLSDRGHKVTVVTLTDKNIPPPAWTSKIQLRRLGGRSNYDPRLIYQIYWLIRIIKPDIVQTWNPQTDILGGVAAICNSCLWIIREPSCSDFYQLGWKGKIRAHLAAKADALVSNSEGGDSYWNSLYPDKHRWIIPNCLPLKLISQTQSVSRQELGVKAGQKILLYVGRLIRLKRVDIIIAAMKKINSELNTVLFICGEGDELENLQAQVDALGLKDWIRFIGRKTPEQVWGMMKSADLFINLSDYEGMPNTVMEAMACGCPLLVSDIPAHREIVDEQSGLLVDSDKEKDIEQALSSFLSHQGDETNLARISMAGEKARSWSIKNMVNSYIEVYQRIITE